MRLVSYCRGGNVPLKGFAVARQGDFRCQLRSLNIEAQKGWSIPVTQDLVKYSKRVTMLLTPDDLLQLPPMIRAKPGGRAEEVGRRATL